MALTAQEEALVRQLLDEQAAILSLASSEPTILSKLGATKKNLSDLTAASAIDDADLLLIRQGTSDKSVSGLIVKSLASQPNASTTTAGIIELATNAEAQAGTDPDRAITPAALASVTATETRAGIAEIATQAETDAGTDDARFVTPLKLKNTSLLGLGYGQIWQNVSASRTSGVTYTNSTGKPIAVSIRVSNSSTTSTTLVIGGVSVFINQGYVDLGIPGSISGVVPVGATYSVSVTGAPGIIAWNELR